VGSGVVVLQLLVGCLQQCTSLMQLSPVSRSVEWFFVTRCGRLATIPELLHCALRPTTADVRLQTSGR